MNDFKWGFGVKLGRAKQSHVNRVENQYFSLFFSGIYYNFKIVRNESNIP